MKKILKFSIKQTLPVLFGYLFLGFAFGLMLEQAGYSFIWAFLSSLFIYAGSGQFLLVSLLSGGVGIFTTIIMTFLINSRHIFYGLSFVQRFKQMGKAYPYMIFSLTDETYSLLCYTKIPEELDQNKTTFTIAVLDQIYWVGGSVLGSLAGHIFTFNSKGIDFAMTALFVVIYIEQWLEYTNHFPAVLGIICGIVSLLVFGPDNFILPSLIITVSVLLLAKNTQSLKENQSHGN